MSGSTGAGAGAISTAGAGAASATGSGAGVISATGSGAGVISATGAGAASAGFTSSAAAGASIFAVAGISWLSPSATYFLPQPSQKSEPGLRSFPHSGQNWTSLNPQLAQNRTSSAISAPHLRHFFIRCLLYIEPFLMRLPAVLIG